MNLDTLRNAPIIGITGKAGSGKTTAANWFLRNHTQVVKLSFARPLKYMVSALLKDVLPKNAAHTPAEYLTNPVLKETALPELAGQTPRYLMQTIGTEWGRQTIHPDFWVNIAVVKMERILASGFKSGKNHTLLCIFDDVRFANEAEMIRAYGGVVVRIERPGAEKPATVASHASEDMDFPADVTFVNDGAVADLEALLHDIWPPTISKKTAD